MTIEKELARIDALIEAREKATQGEFAALDYVVFSKQASKEVFSNEVGRFDSEDSDSGHEECAANADFFARTAKAEVEKLIKNEG